MKRTVIILIIINILCLNTSVFAELTQTDLKKINDLFLESEKRMKEYVDIKIDALDKKLTGQINTVEERLRGEIKAVKESLTGEIKAVKEEIKGVKGSVSMLYGFVIALAALIAIAVGLPQFLLVRREKEEQANKEELKEEILELKRELEKLKQERINR